MPFAYSSEFREMVLDQIRAGRPVAEPPGIWRCTSGLFTAGGVRIASIAAWSRGCRRLRAPSLWRLGGGSACSKAELAAVKRASELFDDKGVMRA